MCVYLSIHIYTHIYNVLIVNKMFETAGCYNIIMHQVKFITKN